MILSEIHPQKTTTDLTCMYMRANRRYSRKNNNDTNVVIGFGDGTIVAQYKTYSLTDDRGQFGGNAICQR